MKRFLFAIMFIALGLTMVSCSAGNDSGMGSDMSIGILSGCSKN